MVVAVAPTAATSLRLRRAACSLVRVPTLASELWSCTCALSDDHWPPMLCTQVVVLSYQGLLEELRRRHVSGRPQAQNNEVNELHGETGVRTGLARSGALWPPSGAIGQHYTAAPLSKMNSPHYYYDVSPKPSRGKLLGPLLNCCHRCCHRCCHCCFRLRISHYLCS